MSGQMNSYDILEVTRYSTMEEIRSSYRKMAKIYHPDINASGTEKFREINDAYGWLMRNHRQLVNVNSVGLDVYYRILDAKDSPFHKVDFPFAEFPTDSKVYFMLGGGEFKIFIPAKTKLPTRATVDLTSLRAGTQTIQFYTKLDKYV